MTEDGHNQRALSLPPVYYGTVDATPLWVCLLHDAWKWGMPADEVEPLLAPMQRCLTWLSELGCRSRRLRQLHRRIRPGPGQPGLEGLLGRRAVP